MELDVWLCIGKGYLLRNLVFGVASCSLRSWLCLGRWCIFGLWRSRWRRLGLCSRQLGGCRCLRRDRLGRGCWRCDSVRWVVLADCIRRLGKEAAAAALVGFHSGNRWLGIRWMVGLRACMVAEWYAGPRRVLFDSGSDEQCSDSRSCCIWATNEWGGFRKMSVSSRCLGTSSRTLDWETQYLVGQGRHLRGGLNRSQAVNSWQDLCLRNCCRTWNCQYLLGLG